MLIKAVGLPTDVFSELFASMKPGTVAIGMNRELDELRSNQELWLFSPSSWIDFIQRLVDARLHEEVVYIGDAIWEKLPMQHPPMVWWPQNYQLSSEATLLVSQLSHDEDWLRLVNIIDPWFLRPDLRDSYCLLESLTECPACLGQRSQVRTFSDHWFAKQNSLAWDKLRHLPHDPELALHVDGCESCQMVMDYIHYSEWFIRLWDNCSLDQGAESGFLSRNERRRWLAGHYDDDSSGWVQKHLMRCERCREMIRHEARSLMADPRLRAVIKKRLEVISLEPLP